MLLSLLSRAPHKRFLEHLRSPFDWRFSGVGSEALLVRHDGGFVGGLAALANVPFSPAP
jgi:hypothetical protein